MRSADWIELDPKNLPSFGRMLVTNGVGAWAVDMVHEGTREIHGAVYAFLDGGGEACALTHYAPIAFPFKKGRT